MCLLNPIPDNSVLIAEGYQEEEKVNSVFQIVGGLQWKETHTHTHTQTLASVRNNPNKSKELN